MTVVPLEPTSLLADACPLAVGWLEPRVTPAGNPTEWPLEQQLEGQLIRAFGELGVPPELIGARRLKVECDWDPVPGPIDLYVERAGETELSLAAELKVANVYETLWDLFKLSALLHCRDAGACFLIVLASDSDWGTPGQCCELFPVDTGERRTHSSRDLIEDSRTGWTRLLKETGRPVRPRKGRNLLSRRRLTARRLSAPRAACHRGRPGRRRLARAQ